MIDLWFPTLIKNEVLHSFSQNNNYLAKKCYDIYHTHPYNSTAWACDTYNTLKNYDPFEDADKTICDLILQCENGTSKFLSEYVHLSDQYYAECTEFWFNLAGPGTYQEYHNHPNSHFSAVYYVKTSEKCGNIIFRDINSFADMFSLPIYENQLKAHKTCYYVPQDSLLLIFRSNLIHMVEKNLSSSDRISISMNFIVKDKFKK
jgi:uncharacterized protein (TIGR02466 family)